jgi:streptomycin 6-kinase
VPEAQAVLAKIELWNQRLVHGDFHHHNILRHGQGWVATDAQPALGEPEFAW